MASGNRRLLPPHTATASGRADVPLASTPLHFKSISSTTDTIACAACSSAQLRISCVAGNINPENPHSTSAKACVNVGTQMLRDRMYNQPMGITARILSIGVHERPQDVMVRIGPHKIINWRMPKSPNHAEQQQATHQPECADQFCLRVAPPPELFPESQRQRDRRANTAGVNNTDRGPRVRNPNGYHHATGTAQILTAVKTATVIITINARKIVEPGRIRAATHPAIDVVARNTIAARTTLTGSSGATNFEIINSAATFIIPITTYTPVAMRKLISQSADAETIRP
jgi:hypothetical protein